ncbi:MAG: hypothetical protein WC285_04440 [Candidatus Gracilibacteria bacterium]|jgi:hypothetical protein
MEEITKVEEFLAFMNKLLKEKLPTLMLNRLEELQIKMSVYHIFEKHHDPEELYYELLDYLDDEGLDIFAKDVDDYYISLNK